MAYKNYENMRGRWHADITTSFKFSIISLFALTVLGLLWIVSGLVWREPWVIIAGLVCTVVSGANAYTSIDEGWFVPLFLQKRRRYINELCVCVETGLLDHQRAVYIYNNSVRWWLRKGPLGKRARKEIYATVPFAAQRQKFDPKIHSVYAHSMGGEPSTWVH